MIKIPTSDKILYVIIIMFFMLGCSEKWEEHYNTYPETVDENVWDAIKQNENLSTFVQYMEQHQLDTIFLDDNPYSIFAPNNDAFENFLAENEIDATILQYHLSKFFIQSYSLEGQGKIKTYTEKFVRVMGIGNQLKFDDIPVGFESPLYLNGKYYIIDQVARPRPNLYEYFASNSPVLKRYIDSQDSIVLDPERSKPIGFNENGNTIYDSVSIIYNVFEEEFFEVSEEFRNKTATIVFPSQEAYNEGLTEMAQVIGGSYIDYNDIPEIWQNEILIPQLLKAGVFENMLEPEEFILQNGLGPKKMQNILGDSVSIPYTPINKTICSNGYAYDYLNFQVPDSLYNLGSRFEMETLLQGTGTNEYAWNEDVEVISSQRFPPYKEYIRTASNDSTIRVFFPDDYSGNFSVEFNSQFLFPRDYLMIVRTHMDYGGIYDIYVNDELVRTFDYYDYVRYGYLLPSVINGRDPYVLEERYNYFDMLVTNIDKFGKAKIRFEFKEPGNVTSNGFVVDYVEFVPVQ